MCKVFFVPGRDSNGSGLRARGQRHRPGPRQDGGYHRARVRDLVQARRNEKETDSGEEQFES